MLTRRPNSSSRPPPRSAIPTIRPASDSSSRSNAIRPPHLLDRHRPPFDRDQRIPDDEHGHHEAIDGVVRIAEERPRHHEPGKRRLSGRRTLKYFEEKKPEDRERRGLRQAEVRARTRNHERVESEQQPGNERRSGISRPPQRVHEHRVCRPDQAAQHQQVVGDRRSEPSDQREGQHVGERGVVVQRQWHRRLIQRKDLPGQERQCVVRQNLVAEHPEVPHINAGIAGGVTRKGSVQVQCERPGERHGDGEVTDQRDEMTMEPARGHRGP